jgi:hypothetical protein
MLNYSGNISMDDAMRLAQSPTGKQLLELLSRTHSAQMEDAMAKASAGDMAGAREALSALMSSPQVMQMLHQMEEL